MNFSSGVFSPNLALNAIIFFVIASLFCFATYVFLAQIIKLYLLDLLFKVAKFKKPRKKQFECYLLIFKEKILLVRTSIRIFVILSFLNFSVFKVTLIFE